MACVAVTSLVRTLELEFLQPQPRPVVLENELISGNKELIQSLCEKLEFLMEQFDEKRMDGVEAIKHLETKLRDVAFRVEDEIELQVVHLYTEVENIQPCLRLRHTLQQAIKDINEIEEEWVRVKNEYKYIMDLQGRKIKLNVLSKSDQVIAMSASSQHASHSGDIMARKRKEFKIVEKMLIAHTSKQREVVSIEGMGGIGKTTLAKQVYEAPSICSHFDKRAWIVASQLHNLRQMLVDILNSISQQDNAESGKDEELKETLYRCLKGQRYLVVMDDVWSKEAWDAFKACFPDDRNGSRILLTTRLAEVANYTCSGSGLSHQVHLLNQSESWNLFCEKACKTHHAGFETTGRPIVEKCKGLPLAIVVVAGLFSKLNTLSEWENIAEALNSSETTTIAEACSRIVALSYNHLPYNLKACFLYFGVFPEDEEIYTNSLARLWAAEGLVKTFENESFEAVAQRHIQELVDRNLILVSKLSSSGRKIKTFRIHDVLHAFSVREAQKENLLIVGKIGFNFLHKDFRWVSIQSVFFDVWTFHTSTKKSRSIFCFPKCVPPYLNLQNLNLLRVLYSSDDKNPIAHTFCRIVHPLIHLRYLSTSMVETFNSNPFNTWNLQTLCDGNYPPYSLDFPQLCHYYRHSYTLLDCPNFVHKNLQSFSGLKLSSCTKELFTKTPCVKKVRILKTEESIVGCTSCIGNLAYLQQLESLTIDVLLLKFKFEYPINNQIALLKILKKLSFISTRFQWEEINILCLLPRLEVLKLGKNSCEGQMWRLREEEIVCQLICLKLDVVVLRHWEVSRHFPKLESLFISWCILKEIPSSFADISTLKSIELMGCPLSVVTSAKQIQEEQHDQGNCNMVVIEKDTLPADDPFLLFYEEHATQLNVESVTVNDL